MFRAAADQEQFHKLLTSQVKGCHCLWRRHGPEDTHVIRILPHPRVQPSRKPARTSCRSFIFLCLQTQATMLHLQETSLVPVRLLLRRDAKTI